MSSSLQLIMSKELILCTTSHLFDPLKMEASLLTTVVSLLFTALVIEQSCFKSHELKVCIDYYRLTRCTY